MRSLVALMACIGCIAWVHSCDERLLGVRVGTQPEVNIPTLASPGSPVDNDRAVFAAASALEHTIVAAPANDRQLAKVYHSKSRAYRKPAEHANILLATAVSEVDSMFVSTVNYTQSTRHNTDLNP
ncbi:hypothetical protein SAMN05444266_107405 [Chitinophaga jiangningensis]|uniref:Uncharacterized protein n=1 Tax=Chitinophaga jiangningensis TaxID=1419482 RepID=A0A1M7HWL1_9BACT|nr:hypothetical protein [Chitinophaga jiangningensis]SHM32723.1 hypothetical protein SAMN05444266_107405 [Chitinophaga jiangningensis]